LRGIAFAACCDQRTVVSYLRGLKQAPLTRERIEIALRVTKHETLIRPREPVDVNGAPGPTRTRD
jgi:hypothetical protein